jgi:hypothetical protein
MRLAGFTTQFSVQSAKSVFPRTIQTIGKHLRDTLTRAYRSSFRPRLSFEREQGLFRAGEAGWWKSRTHHPATIYPRTDSSVRAGRAVVPSPLHAQPWPVEAKPSPAIFMRELSSLAAHLRATDPEFHAEEINRLTGSK